MISCTTTGTVRILDVEKPGIERMPKVSNMSKSFSVTHTREGKYIITDHRVGEIYFWETKSGKQAGRYSKVHTGIVERKEVPKDGQWIVSLSTDHTVAVCNVENRKVETKFQIEKCKDVTSLDVYCDGARILIHISED